MIAINYRVISQVLVMSFAILTAVASPISTAVTSIGVVGFLIFCFLAYSPQQLFRNAWKNPIAKSIAPFGVWILIGSLYSGNDFKHISAAILSWQKLLIVFLLLGLPVTVLWKNRFLKTYILSLSVAGVLTIICWFLGIGRAKLAPGILMVNPDAQSMGFMFLIAASVWLWFENRILSKKLLLPAILIGLVNVFYICDSRSCLVAFPIMLGFILYQKISLKKLPLVILGVAVIFSVFAFTSDSFKTGFKQAIQEQRDYANATELTSVGIRIVFYENTLALARERSIFGYGTSAFEKTYSEYVGHKTGIQATPAKDPHNQYLFILLENGLIGLILFSVYIWIVFKQLNSCNPYSAIAVTTFLIVTTTSLFNSHFKTYPEGHLLAFFVGFLLNRVPQKA